MPREKPVTERIMALIRRRGGAVWKNHGSLYSGSGRPDVEGGYRGRHVLVETKSLTGTLSPIQRATCWQYCAAGSLVCIAAGSTQHVVAMLDGIDIDLGGPRADGHKPNAPARQAERKARGPRSFTHR